MLSASEHAARGRLTDARALWVRLKDALALRLAAAAAAAAGRPAAPALLMLPTEVKERCLALLPARARPAASRARACSASACRTAGRQGLEASYPLRVPGHALPSARHMLGCQGASSSHPRSACLCPLPRRLPHATVMWALSETRMHALPRRSPRARGDAARARARSLRRRWTWRRPRARARSCAARRPPTRCGSRCSTPSSATARPRPAARPSARRAPWPRPRPRALRGGTLPAGAPTAPAQSAPCPAALVWVAAGWTARARATAARMPGPLRLRAFGIRPGGRSPARARPGLEGRLRRVLGHARAPAPPAPAPGRASRRPPGAIPVRRLHARAAGPGLPGHQRRRRGPPAAALPRVWRRPARRRRRPPGRPARRLRAGGPAGPVPAVLRAGLCGHAGRVRARCFTLALGWGCSIRIYGGLSCLSGRRLPAGWQGKTDIGAVLLRHAYGCRFAK